MIPTTTQTQKTIHLPLPNQFPNLQSTEIQAQRNKFQTSKIFYFGNWKKMCNFAERRNPSKRIFQT